jgi:hypothetical protein
MKMRAPTSEEIEELVAFLPKLYAEGFEPVKYTMGGRNPNGVVVLPMVIYKKVVYEFMDMFVKECWRVPNYRDKAPERMFTDKDVIKTADLDEVKAMLMYCVRGEHFCNGYLIDMIKDGYIRCLLERLIELNSDSV